MNKKRLIALTMAVLMMMVIFLGCQQTEKSGQSTTTPAPSTVTPEKPVTLKVISRNNGFAKDNNNIIFKKMEELSGYKFDWDLRASEGYPQACQVIIASGDYPDMMEFWSVTYPVEIQEMAEDGIIIPMDEIVAEYGPHILAVRPDYTWYVNPKDGKRYGISQRTSEHKTNEIPIVRKDWMDKVGITKVPESFKELKEMLVAFRDNSELLVGKGRKVIPYCTFIGPQRRIETGLFHILSSSYGFGRSWNVVNKDVVYHVNMPGYKETLASLRELYQEGLLDAEYSLINRQQQLDKCNSGIVGVADWTIDQMETSAQFYMAYKQANPELEIVPMFAFPDASGNRYVTGAAAHMNKTIIFSNSDKQVECVKYLDWCCTDEGSHLLEMGIEGKNWDMGADGYPVLKEMATEEKVALGFFSYNWLARTFGSIPYYSSSIVRKTSDFARTYAELPAVVGTTEFGRTEAPALEEFMRTSETELICSKGINFDANFETYVKKWNEMGGATWSKEMSEQYRKELEVKGK